jgi:hypothetical protein
MVDGDSFSTRIFVAAARRLDDVVTFMAASRERSLALDELLGFALGREDAEEGLMLRVCSLNSVRGAVGAVGAVRLMAFVGGHSDFAMALSEPMPAPTRGRLVADPVMMMVGMETDPGLLAPSCIAVGDDFSCTCVGGSVVL